MRSDVHLYKFVASVADTDGTELADFVGTWQQVRRNLAWYCENEGMLDALCDYCVGHPGTFKTTRTMVTRYVSLAAILLPS
jgi:hypothetical protein